MQYIVSLPAAFLALSSLLSTVNAATDMGPAAFMWPPDREWGAAQDNTPPCGSSAGATTRTEFPLANGAVALVLQDDSFNVTLAIAYSNDPTQNSDFTTIVSSSLLPDLDPGHQCFSIPNPPSSVSSGSNATIQMSYVADFDDKGVNETFYACADITFVTLSSFSTNIPCFNVSAEDPTEITTSTPATAATASATGSSSTGSSAPVTSGGSGSGGGLGKGAIAGIVVGSLAGAAVLGAALFFLWRRHRAMKKREEAIQLRMKDMTNPARSSGLSSER